MGVGTLRVKDAVVPVFSEMRVYAIRKEVGDSVAAGEELDRFQLTTNEETDALCA